METVRTHNKAKYNATDIVLLILRIAVGGWLMYAGIPKLIGGPGGEHGWTKLGESVGMFGIHFAPTFWGFMAAFAEGVGGLLIALGFIFRPAAFLALCTMFVAAYMHVTVYKGGQWPAVTLGVLCLIFLFTGPGRISVDNRRRV